MAIELVLYKKGNDYDEITLEDIENRSDFEIVRQNLYCAFEGCPARIEYVPKGKRIAHFKTWPMSDHSTDCTDFFNREKQKAGKKSLASSSVALTDKHINNVLRNLINTVEETEEEKQTRLEKQRARNKNRKNKITDKLKGPELTENVRPTTDINSDTIEEGKRAPSVKRRYSISLLSEDDIHTATALYERVENINIEKSRVIVKLKRINREANVYFEENFFNNSARNINSMFEIVKKHHDSGNPVELYCVGNVEKRNGNICLVVNKQSHIRFNKMTIERFTFKITNPELF
ncbi:hypothetical protein J2Z40_003721 [Cytobacillus eiseniae]|uniref:Uncharacterized protein n=1 Tax=Cytobacillus eiseniae TaxID=762947 RepID=A0ABS4RJQ6_9BACI|nr:hypothetical protein [Cytobacillus eiseniae]MBP2243133.1 hypothetical protein [Cytobacillus eiseniae]